MTASSAEELGSLDNDHRVIWWRRGRLAKRGCRLVKMEEHLIR